MTDIDLPDSVPIFPLKGAMLLPTGNIPLHIFEPQYLSMVNDALRSPERLIGMIQPKDTISDLYDIGCAGRITSFEELSEDRYIISLTGVSRFTYVSDEATDAGYRVAKINNDIFREDQTVEACLSLDRERLTALLKLYFEHHDLNYNMDVFEEATDHKLITCLSMMCPFKPSEKQALLEAKCCKARANLFMTMLEIETHDTGCSSIQ
jgi:hypothetical protein